jgi:hypothetical protein
VDDVSSRNFLTEIGEGGFGTVHLAADEARGVTYVVKLGRVGTRDGIPARWPQLLPRLRALAGHPSVLPIIDAGTTGPGRPYLVLERAAGGSLADRLARRPLDLLDAVRIGIQLAGALEATHRIGLVHGDLKPTNVLFDDRGDALLADVSTGSLSAGRSAPVRTYLASVEHLAPEVLAGGELNPTADQYAFGSLLHTMITGEAVFPLAAGEPLPEYARRVRGTPLPSLRSLDWPADLAEVMERLLAKDPADRFSGMRAAAQALQAVDYARRGVTTPLHIRIDQGVAEPVRSAEPVPDRTAAAVAAAYGAGAAGTAAGPTTPPPTPVEPTTEPSRTGRRGSGVRRSGPRRALVGGAVAVGGLLVVGSWLLGGGDDDQPDDTEVLDETEVATVPETTTTTSTTASTTTTTFVLPPLPTLPPDFVPVTEAE